MQEIKKLGRKRKYGPDMQYVTAYLPTKIVKIAEDLQTKKRLSSFNEALNMVFASTDPKLVDFISNRWSEMVEAIDRSKQSLDDFKQIAAPGKLISEFDFQLEAVILIDEFLTEKYPRVTNEGMERIKQLEMNIESKNELINDIYQTGSTTEDNPVVQTIKEAIMNSEREIVKIKERIEELAKAVPEEQAQGLSKKAIKDFEFWIAERGKLIKNKTGLQYLIYKRLRERV